MRRQRQRAHLVPTDRFLEVAVALWVLVVGPDKDALLASWHRKGSNTSHDICNNLSRPEKSCNPLVFCVELAVPVYLGVVELENAAGLAHLHAHVIRTTKDFVGKGPELVL